MGWNVHARAERRKFYDDMAAIRSAKKKTAAGGRKKKDFSTGQIRSKERAETRKLGCGNRRAPDSRRKV